MIPPDLVPESTKMQARAFAAGACALGAILALVAACVTWCGCSGVAGCRHACDGLAGGGVVVESAAGFCLCAPRPSLVFVDAGCTMAP